MAMSEMSRNIGATCSYLAGASESEPGSESDSDTAACGEPEAPVSAVTGMVPAVTAWLPAAVIAAEWTSGAGTETGMVPAPAAEIPAAACPATCTVSAAGLL